VAAEICYRFMLLMLLLLLLRRQHMLRSFSLSLQSLLLLQFVLRPNLMLLLLLKVQKIFCSRMHLLQRYHLLKRWLGVLRRQGGLLPTERLLLLLPLLLLVLQLSLLPMLVAEPARQDRRRRGGTR